MIVINASVSTISLDEFVQEAIKDYESPSLLIVDDEALNQDRTKVGLVLSSPLGETLLADEQERIRDLARRYSVTINYLEACDQLAGGPVLTERTDYVVLGAWPVQASSADQFRAITVKNAKASVAREAGCKYFLVYESVIKSNLFFLVEGFSGISAFEAHLETPHFKEFASIGRPIFMGDRSLTIKGYGIRVKA